MNPTDKPEGNSSIQQVLVQVPSHPKFLRLVRKSIKEISDIAGFCEKDISNIILAVDEACSNIIKHSYLNDPKGRIDVLVLVSEKGLEILITDYGRKCEPSKLVPEDITEIKPGGFGVYIMDKVMDSLVFDCSLPKEKRLKMVKHL